MFADSSVLCLVTVWKCMFSIMNVMPQAIILQNLEKVQSGLSGVYCFIYMADMLFSHTPTHPLRPQQHTHFYSHRRCVISDLFPLKVCQLTPLVCWRVSVCAWASLWLSFAQFVPFNMRHCLIYNRRGEGGKSSLWCSGHTCWGVYEPIMCLSSHYKPQLKSPAAQQLEQYTPAAAEV